MVLRHNVGDKMELKKALEELRKLEKRKFDQGIDLIINLKGIDVKKDNISTIITVPNKFKEKKVCGFLTKKSEIVRTITEPDFPKYKEKKTMKSLVKEYDFFIAVPTLMAKVATNFGKFLGPSGKMPSPQLGVVMQEDDAKIKEVLTKIEKAIKIRVKEPSVKNVVAKENMSDDKILENIRAVYNGIVNALPNKRDNIKSVMIKFTMNQPEKITF